MKAEIFMRNAPAFAGVLNKLYSIDRIFILIGREIF